LELLYLRAVPGRQHSGRTILIADDPALGPAMPCIVAIANDEPAIFAGHVAIALAVDEQNPARPRAAQVRKTLVDGVITGYSEFFNRHIRPPGAVVHGHNGLHCLCRNDKYQKYMDVFQDP